jgi:hypothetical protein
MVRPGDTQSQGRISRVIYRTGKDKAYAGRAIVRAERRNHSIKIADELIGNNPKEEYVNSRQLPNGNLSRLYL